MSFARSKAPWKLTALAAAMMAAGSVSAQDYPSPEEMWRIIQEQQKQIDKLLEAQSATEEKVQATEEKVQATEEKVQATEEKVQATEEMVLATDEKVEATGELLEEVAAGGAEGGMVDGWWTRTSIGGYGELHYNGGNKDEIDFHRFVLYFGHEFNDRIRMFSELEFEHAFVEDTADGSNGGAVELEQAYVEFDIGQMSASRVGLFLIPVGILNETHEPPTFFGVERNIVESAIIPTTWWEGGVSGHTRTKNGFGFDVAFHSGLEVNTTTYRPRSGRNKVSLASAENGALTGRVRWTGIPGVELALTGQFQDDMTQGTDPSGQAVEGLLIETHANIRRGPWSFRALYAQWDLDGTGPQAVGADEQYGFYIEPGYYIPVGNHEVGLFVQYAEVDNNAGNDADTKVIQNRAGVSWLPHPQVVLKADYQVEDRPNPDAEDDRLNLGMGFMF